MSNVSDADRILELLRDTNSFTFFGFAVTIMVIGFCIGLGVFYRYRNSPFLNRRDCLLTKFGTKIRVNENSKLWVIDCFFWKSEWIFRKLGIDSLVLFLTTRLFLILSIIITIFSIILLPCHWSASKPNQGIIFGASIASVPNGSQILIVHFVLLYAITGLLCTCLYFTFKHVVYYRQLLFSNDPLTVSSLLIYDYGEISGNESLEKVIKNDLDLVISTTERSIVYVLRNYKLVSYAIRKHDAIIDKKMYFREYTRTKTASGTSEDPEQSNLIVKKLDEKINAHYTEMKKVFAAADKEPLSAAAVFLANVGIAQAFRCTSLSVNKRSAGVTLLPEPKEIIWRNLALHKHIRKFNSTLIYFLTALAIVFWAFQFALVSGISKSFAITDRSVGPVANDKVMFFLKFITNTFIPLILIQMILYGEHLFFKKLSTYENHVSYAAADFSILAKMCIFNAIDTILIYVASSSLIELFLVLLDHPLEITKVLASSIPLQSNFFMIYLSFQGLIMGPWYLLKSTYFIRDILFSIKNCRDKKPKRKYRRYFPTPSDYIYKYSIMILVFGIGLLFSIISPLICIVWFPYFFIIHIIYAYDEERNNINTFSYKGEYWPIISNCIIIYLLFLQLLMIGMFAFKQFAVLSFGSLPLLFGTIYFMILIRQRFQKAFKYPTVETMQKINISTQDMEERLGRYKLEAFLPPVDRSSEECMWENIARKKISGIS